MQPKFGLKHFIGTFLVCVAAYFVAFYGIEHYRNSDGPWQITFTAKTNGPAILISQPALQIRNLELVFPNAPATNAGSILVFDQALPVPFDVPYGQCVFLDTTTLPGTVVLQLFGHEIQLLPRVLTIDGQERTWQSDTIIPLED